MDQENENPALFRKLSEPLESQAQALAAINGFFAEVSDLRKKYHLPNVVMCVQLNAHDGDQEMSYVAHQTLGNMTEWPMLAARLYSTVKKQVDDKLALALQDAQEGGR